MSRILPRYSKLFQRWLDTTRKPNFVKFLPRRKYSDSVQGTTQIHTEPRNPSIRDFMAKSTVASLKQSHEPAEDIPYLDKSLLNGDGLRVHFEIHGCQMNFSDIEVVWSVLQAAGYSRAESSLDADVILFVTCAIREGAENKIWKKVKHLRELKEHKTLYGQPLKIGIIGCMAERLKEKALERDKLIDLVAGPDSYRDLPRLLALTRSDQKAVNVLLSLDETYADIMPVRLNQDSVTAYLTIMRGCDNMCTYCIVPFTRGRERSRPIDSILDEVRSLSDQGVKEITLLGQNVNSYRDTSTEKHFMSSSGNEQTTLAKGFKTVYKPKKGGIRFAELLDKVSDIDPEIRIRFTSPHPKDFPDEVLQVIKEKNNLCKCFHLPAQSGNNEILERMRRGYTREAYLELVQKIRDVLPDVTFTSDFIVGFCGETDEQFQDTISLAKAVKYHKAFTFAYSMREKTTAHRRYKDDVPQDVKINRIELLAESCREDALEVISKDIGNEMVILIEGDSRRSDLEVYGKTDGNIKVNVVKGEIPISATSDVCKQICPGDYIVVKITEVTSLTMKGIPLHHTSIGPITCFDKFNESYPTSINVMLSMY